MIELGELNKRHAEFANREVRIVAVSADGLKDTEAIQADFPHLAILSDEKLSLVNALNAAHTAPSTQGKTIAAPTTLLVHHNGRIVWLFRPSRHIERLSVDELLARISGFAPQRHYDLP